MCARGFAFAGGGGGGKRGGGDLGDLEEGDTTCTQCVQSASYTIPPLPLPHAVTEAVVVQ